MRNQLALTGIGMLLLTAGSASALVEPPASPLAAKEVRVAGLDAEPTLERVADLAPGLAADFESRLTVLGLDPRFALVDARGLAWATLWLKQPLIPGTGAGNELTWSGFGHAAAPDAQTIGDAAWDQFVAFLAGNRQQLGIDPAQLEKRVGIAGGGRIVQIHAARKIGGVPVRGAAVVATVNLGNLILLGTERWGAIDVATVPTLTAEAAMDRLEAHLAPVSPDRYRDEPRLEILPLGTGGPAGQGWSHRLAWILEPHFNGLGQRYEAAVDAHNGQVLLLEDTNHYATRNVKGGVYPVSYDGIVPDGVEVPGLPMPFATITHTSGSSVTDSGGNVFDATGTMSGNLAGPFIRMNDLCGAINESSAAGDLDFGSGGAVNCGTPPGSASAGNTHSSRTGFYELNRIAEQARGYWPDPGPANTWLNSQLTSNMNINQTCGAFWNGGTVNFYREGGNCGNTGQLAGVFDHEWGHGIDDNGTAGTVSSPGEGIADLYAALRLGQSCVGRGFRINGLLCGGYGDPCTPASGCTGVRDIDWANRTSGLPHTVTWVNGNPNCGSVHCRGALYSESVWDLWKRDLPAIYGMDDLTAQEITTRLTYLGADNVTTWFVLNNGTQGGCAATSGYQQFLGVDDDNGDLTDGTPHMQALFSAFNRHEIACNTPTVQDSGCASRPAAGPAVTITPGDTTASLNWTAVPDATRYKIYRTDGVFGCNFGKVLVGETTGTDFSDTGLQNGREHYYMVAAFGSSDSCMGPASACATVTPVGSGGPDIFEDGFESGDTSAWTATVP